VKVAIINASPDCYNLACEKIRNWQASLGNEVFSLRIDDQGTLEFEALACDKAFISAIHSYDVPRLVQAANMLQSRGVAVECGGPGTVFLSRFIAEKTGIKPMTKIDERFEHISGDYEWTFSSRGCPRYCPFCVVSHIEGSRVIEYPYFVPAPNLSDNNLLMTSLDHQQRVVEKLKQFSQVDINSGFDCRIFAKKPKFYYDLYSKLKLKMWRFAWDVPEEEKPIKETLKFMAWMGHDRHTVQVYILCNYPGVSPDEVKRRAEIVLRFGGMPYLMKYIPLDSLNSHYVAPGWTEKDFQKLISYYNFPSVWMKTTYA